MLSRRSIVRSATANTCTQSGGYVATALRAIDEYAASTEFMLGHNVVEHNPHYLRETSSSLRLLIKPPIDTLWLNPLTFPRNPYHRLVKHYEDGRLQPATPEPTTHTAG